MRDRIIEMLGRNIPAMQVAAAVGCDDSYISQIMSDPDTALKVQELRTVYYSEYIEQDARTDRAEAAALAKVEQLLPFIMRPAEAVRVYAVLNAARRRTVDAAAATTQLPAQTVVLDLPAATRVRFTTTPDRQVIEVEGRSLTTMPARNLSQQLEQRNAQRLLNAPVPMQLPGLMQKRSEIPLADKL